MNTISILGSGWLGIPLAVSLLEDGYTVKGSTRSLKKEQDLLDLGISPFIVDIEDYEEFDDFLNTDILIIAITSKDVTSYERLITQIEDSPVQKVIFISSTSVYPKLNKEVTENDATLDTPLANIEQLFRENTYFETTILRFSGLFGLQRHPANWFRDGRKIPNPSGYVNMIHLDDCIEIIHTIINTNKWSKTYNACAPHHPTREIFYTKARLSKGLEPPVFDNTTSKNFKIVSSKKLQEDLNYTFIKDNLLDI